MREPFLTPVLLSLFFISPITSFSLLCGPVQAKSEAGYIFKQDSTRYGRLTCYVTPHNFRMDAMDLRLYVKPPFTMVSMYNMESKITYRVSVDQISQRLSIRSLSEKDKKAGTKEELKKIGERTICGFKCDTYRSEHVKKDGKRTPKILIFATHDLKLPKAMENACAKLTDCPPDLGFPARLQLFESVKDAKKDSVGFKMNQVLNTDKCTPATVDDAQFIEPTGYKPARDETEVIMGDVSM